MKKIKLFTLFSVCGLIFTACAGNPGTGSESVGPTTSSQQTTEPSTPSTRPSSSEETRYTINWYDDVGGNIIDSDEWEPGEIPFTLFTPTKEPEGSKTFTFKCWSPEPYPADKDQDYVAVYNEQIVRNVTIAPNDSSKGSVDVSSLVVNDQTEYSISGNVLTIGDVDVTATAKFGYEFDSWEIDPELTGKITSDVTFKAKFVDVFAVADLYDFAGAGYTINKNQDNSYTISWTNKDAWSKLQAHVFHYNRSELGYLKVTVEAENAYKVGVYYATSEWGNDVDPILAHTTFDSLHTVAFGTVPEGVGTDFYLRLFVDAGLSTSGELTIKYEFVEEKESITVVSAIYDNVNNPPYGITPDGNGGYDIDTSSRAGTWNCALVDVINCPENQFLKVTMNDDTSHSVGIYCNGDPILNHSVFAAGGDVKKAIIPNALGADFTLNIYIDPNGALDVGTLNLKIELEERTGKAVTIVSEDASKGSVDVSSLDVLDQTAYSINGNVLTIGDTDVTATPEFGYAFDAWDINPSLSGSITSDVTFTAKFKAAFAVSDITDFFGAGYSVTKNLNNSYTISWDTKGDAYSKLQAHVVNYDRSSLGYLKVTAVGDAAHTIGVWSAAGEWDNDGDSILGHTSFGTEESSAYAAVPNSVGTDFYIRIFLDAGSITSGEVTLSIEFVESRPMSISAIYDNINNPPYGITADGNGGYDIDTSVRAGTWNKAFIDFANCPEGKYLKVTVTSDNAHSVGFYDGVSYLFNQSFAAGGDSVIVGLPDGTYTLEVYIDTAGPLDVGTLNIKVEVLDEMPSIKLAVYDNINNPPYGITADGNGGYDIDTSVRAGVWNKAFVDISNCPEGKYLKVTVTSDNAHIVGFHDGANYLLKEEFAAGGSVKTCAIPAGTYTLDIYFDTDAGILDVGTLNMKVEIVDSIA